MRVLVRELAALYRAFAAGAVPSPLPELPITYADFARWQREWLRGEVLEAELAYWRTQLADAPVLELPADRPRPAVQSSRGAHLGFALPDQLGERLEQLSLEHHATLFMTLLAAFKVLLYRITGQHDLAIGTPIANRTHPQVEPLIGFFVNTLVLRTDTPGWRFTEFLGRVREVALQAYAHQHLPFEVLVDALGVERDPSRTPLFQAMFIFQNAPVERLELPGLVTEPIAAETGAATFELTLSMSREAGSFVAAVEYNTDRFDEVTVRRMVGHYERLLEGIAAHPDAGGNELALLTEAQAHRLLTEWNDTAEIGVERPSLLRLFAAQVASDPGAVAVELDNRRLSYVELNRRANQLAWHLRALDVGPEVLVGLFMERSPELIIAALGILKAGGAYLALDPDDPQDRLAFMLENSGVTVLLTHAPLAEKLPLARAPGAPAFRVICPDSESSELRHRSPENPPEDLRPEHPAYVIYTSGSTGRPKGVVVRHRSLFHRTEDTARAYALGPGDRVLQFASISFDTSAEEIYPCLVGGAALVLRPAAMLASGAGFMQEVEDRGITVLDLPTALWHEHCAGLEAGELRLPATVRLVILGGEEALAPRLICWRRHVSSRVRLVNVYGPTETTIYCTRWELTDQVPENAVPIGRPVRGTRVYLLDRFLQPVPEGIPGELAVGGVGIARGYLKRPGLTAERFVPDPFAREPAAGARLYRTGDRACTLPDGNLRFLGRFDTQVKIRGYRIEPGEIEAVLRRYPSVQEAAVVARDQGPAERSLVAYIVERTPAAPLRDADLLSPPLAAPLRKFLQEKLPDYMVPSQFIVLPALPLTPRGKLDRRALPEPTAPAVDAPPSSAAPRSPVEEILAGIFAQVLERAGIGVDDDFFALGGHSLRATQVAARVQKAFGVELRVITLFEAPTVAELAERVAEAQRAGHTTRVPPIVPGDRRAPLPEDGVPLSFAQQRLWFLNRMQPQSTAYNMPLALRLRGEPDLEALRRVFEEVVRRHAVLRTTFVTREGEPRQLILPPPGAGSGERWPLPVIDLRLGPDQRRELELRRRARTEARRPFDLSRDRPLRTAILVLGPREHVLLFTLHHIAADGWSMGVLVSEIGALYPAFTAGRRSPLPELEIEYADFAQWQRRWFRGEVLEAELAYWRQQLADVPVLALPADHPRPPVPTSRGAHLDFKLPARLSRGLEHLGLKEDATLFMTLLAAFKGLLHRFTGQRDLCVGTPIANRTQEELEPLIGFFDNTLVLRTRLSNDRPDGAPWGGLRFTELLGRVREVALGAYAHQNLPFERLVETLDVVRDPSRSPLFQVMFAFQNAPAGTLELPGLTLEPVTVETGTSTFDLTLSFSREPEGLSCLVEYNTDLFGGTTIRRMTHHLAHLLEGIVADPGKRLGELPLASSAESHQLRVEWNDRRALRLRQPSIVPLFAARVERSPDAVAVVFEGAQLSYREFDRRANRLAHHLRDLGVGAGTRVGIALRRSPEMVAGVLGILKAGAAYVSLDPSHPAGRLAWQLADAGASVVLVRSPSTDPISGTSAHRVYLAGQSFAHRDDHPSGAFDPASTAYVLFTSGSTGRPKGVSVTHENLAHSTAARIGYYGEAGRLLLLPSLAIDASVGGLFWTLLSGGTLWLVPEEAQGDPAALGSLIARGRISRLLCIPSLWSALLAEGLPRELGSLRTVIVGGESCSPELVDRHRARLPRTALYNEYGLTEATVWSTVHRCESVAGTVPIGRPIAGTQVLILDPYGHPVPIGVPGELAIGGLGMARGYLGRPPLTAERFIPHPFASVPGSRLYRTGDLARHLPEHAIEYLGRIDQEVKIRGFRVEPGEIEAVLAEHPGLREAAIVAWDDGSGQRRLVAYVVGRLPGSEGDRSASVPAAELRGFLRERLPEHMVPARFVFLDALPHTPAGKLDRRALPAPESSRPQLESAPVAPRTGIERAIAAIWRDVLGLDEVGVDDNFFELGGHSLAIIKVAARLRERLHRDLPISELFMHPTIRSLAQHLSRGEISDLLAESAPSPAQGRIARRDSLRRQRQRRRRLLAVHSS